MTHAARDPAPAGIEHESDRPARVLVALAGARADAAAVAPPSATRQSKAAHALASRTLEALLVVLAWLLMPLLPFAASAIAGDWSYLRRYPRTLGRLASHIAATWRDDAVSRAWLMRFDESAGAGSGRVVGSCTHCGNCCLHKRCIFLGFDVKGQSFCRIYGGKVWRLLPCGRYPVTQADIDLYACPSFYTVPEPGASGMRVIPVHPVFSGARRDRELGS